MDFKIIVTLGPAILNEEKLAEIAQHGSCLFRLNGAHTDPENVDKVVELVRGVLPEAKFMLDLPGNKVRLSGLSEPLRLVKDEYIDIHEYQLNFPEFYRYIKPGEIVLAHDSIYRLEVVEVKGKTIRFLSHSDGILLSRKGLHVKGVSDSLPFLFDRDLALIKSACECKLDYLALSFVRNADDIRFAKEMVSKYNADECELISKVETSAAVENLDEILTEINAILIDRGDLSADIGIHNLACHQENIISAAKKAGKKIYLATQFLKNMEKHPLPLIAETLDLHKTLKAGISGIQLSEETAVGAYPVQCVEYVFKTLEGIRNEVIPAGDKI